MTDWCHHNYEVNEWSMETRYFNACIQQHDGQGDLYYTFCVKSRLGCLIDDCIEDHASSLWEAKQMATQAGLALWLHAYVKDRRALRDLKDQSLHKTAETMLSMIAEASVG